MNDEVRVETASLRAAANKWFPAMVDYTNEAKAQMLDGIDKVDGAFLDVNDVYNGIHWIYLMTEFAEALRESSERLDVARSVLLLAADSYEDTDESSSMRIEESQR